MSPTVILLALAVQMAAADVPPPPAASATPAPTAAPTPTPTPAGVIVLFKTSKGDIKLELDREKAPISVDNFLQYVKAKHYDGTIFHRVKPGFMIQGGGMNVSLMPKPTRPGIKNEHSNGLRNDRGTISMARMDDPNSATSQFFINVADNPFLDHGPGYAVFGKVVEGMDVADRIANVPRTVGPDGSGAPKEPIIVETARVLFDPKAPAEKAAAPPAKSADKPAAEARPQPKSKKKK
jgi:peptidyl-prolyl cis-trans isomerase A (cyclophilin A)